MAEDKATAPVASKEHKYSQKLLDKYNVIGPSLQPSKIDFGINFGGFEADLREDSCLPIVDKLVADYPNQTFFKAKAIK